ncbi:hypothetical protein CCMSSC00406_0007022 [Pleurotus cornucopiae]|uniref:Uncharacterized protein n=1 Tax=Pleurotus cornucopiae TaxID=5321 RepID=A0ACB7J513_PLECO|nr:hypothetical protein CCMSSC00406_0007022 [Pleurotus cornucopiae]
MYAVSTLAQFMAAPRKTHLIAAKRVFRYIKGTLTLALTLGGDTLVGYSDADFASHMDRRSISGFCFFIGSGVISWSSKKQPLVTLSSVESEYVALTHAAKELIWLQRLIQELFVKLNLPTILYCDNQGAITISKDSTFHMCMKHIDTRFHFIRQTVNDDQAQIIYCPTDKMIADIFTKSLG